MCVFLFVVCMYVSVYVPAFIHVCLCVPVLVHLLLELQSEMSYRFVLDEVQKQVRQTHLWAYGETHCSSTQAGTGTRYERRKTFNTLAVYPPRAV